MPRGRFIGRLNWVSERFRSLRRRSYPRLIMLVSGGLLLCLGGNSWAQPARSTAIPATNNAGASQGTKAVSNRVLTNVLSVLALTPAEAGQRVPVRLTAQMIYCDNDWGIWFLKDDTAGICLYRPSPTTNLDLGRLVEVEGVSETGAFAPIIEERRIKPLGVAPLPKASPSTFDDLVSVSMDSQWVEVEAIVEAVSVESNHLQLELTGLRDFRAFIPGFPAGRPAPTNWVDARLRFRGVWATTTNRRGQGLSNKLLVPSVDQVRLVTPRALEAGQIPLQPIESTFRFHVQTGQSRRIKVAGVVTATLSRSLFYIQDGSGGLRIHTRQKVDFQVGESVEVVGFPSMDQETPQLEEASVQRLGRAVQPPPVMYIPAKTELNAEAWEGLLITVEGDTIGVVPHGGHAELVFRAGNEFVSALLSGTNAARELAAYKPLSRVRVTGVCSLSNRDRKLTTPVQLVLRSANDVAELRREPWWTVPKALAVLATVSALLVYWRMTEQTKAAAKLRESEQRFRELAETINEVFWVAEAGETRTLYISPAYEKTFGRTCQSLYDNPMSWFDSTIPEDRERVVRASQELPTNGSYDLEYRIHTGDGAVRWIQSRAFPVRDGSGGTRRIVRVAVDITAQKQEESRRQELEAQLRQSQKMEAIGTLAGGIAHDFNNILGAILGSAEVAGLEIPKTHPAQAALREIVTSSLRARDMVRQILTFSRRQSQELKLVDPKLLLTDAKRLLAASLPSTIEIQVEMDASIPAINADSTQVHQVIMNLGNNAAYAMRGKKGRLGLTLDMVIVGAGAASDHGKTRPGKYVRFGVADDGQGMDAATLERIFEPFFTTKAMGEGTGLGLSVVHGIMENHQGAINVKSAPGKGARFDLYFPACDKPSRRASAPVPVKMPMGTGELVLCVDDELILGRVMSRVLERLNYRVTFCESGSAALIEFRKNPESFAVVLTDLTMPGMTGLELTAKLRELSPGVPVILISGYTSEFDETTARQYGVRACLGKPCETRLLAETLRESIGTDRVKPVF